MRVGIFALLAIAAVSILRGGDPADVVQVKTILATQVDAWNRGDLEGFMQGYLPSEELVFIGSKGLTYGWKQTLANYHSSYPDRETMGKLTFTLLELKPLGAEHMLVIGKWHLARQTKDDAAGHFSLTWQKREGKWFIIADHSS